MKTTLSLLEIYGCLFDRFGPLKWWPADSAFEVCVGAILTQNTAWINVEKAINALKQAGIMTPESLQESDSDKLAQLIRPAGFFNVKCRRLKDFTSWLFLKYLGSMELMFSRNWLELREELLMVRGIGPETADSILLYAGHKPTFVVDAYTHRLFHRLGLLAKTAGYNEIRTMFMENLPKSSPVYNEYHAQIVEQCKHFCRVKPLCNECPLCDFCPSRLT